MVKLRENPHLERFLAMISLVVIALNLIICLIVLEVRNYGNAKTEVAKKMGDSSASKKQHVNAGNKNGAFH